MLEYTVEAYRSSPRSAAARSARASGAAVPLDIDPAGRPDAFNPAELLLTALAACLLKGIERVAPMLTFELRGAAVRVRGTRQDAPPRMSSVDYELAVDTDEPDSRLDLLHRNLQKYGTVFNTLAGAVDLTGTIHRGRLAAAGGSASPPAGTGPSQEQ